MAKVQPTLRSGNIAVARRAPGRSGASPGWVLVFFLSLQLGSFLQTVTPTDGRAAVMEGDRAECGRPCAATGAALVRVIGSPQGPVAAAMPTVTADVRPEERIAQASDGWFVEDHPQDGP